MLTDMPPLRLLHLTRLKLRLGWLFSWLAETILLLAPHLAVTLRGGSRHWLRRVKALAPCGMPGGVVAVVPYILLVMVAN
jgi:hypothetical protein